MFLNDDSHVEGYWAEVNSEANRLTLRKPSQAGCPVSSVPLCRIHSLGMEQVVFLVCLFVLFPYEHLSDRKCQRMS